MIEQVTKASCDICPANDISPKYKFPPGYKYFYSEGSVFHACSECVASMKTHSSSFCKDDLKNKSKIILCAPLLEIKDAFTHFKEVHYTPEEIEKMKENKKKS